VKRNVLYFRVFSVKGPFVYNLIVLRLFYRYTVTNLYYIIYLSIALGVSSQCFTGLKACFFTGLRTCALGWLVGWGVYS
jgi:hypothetical protein